MDDRRRALQLVVHFLSPMDPDPLPEWRGLRPDERAYIADVRAMLQVCKLDQAPAMKRYMRTCRWRSWARLHKIRMDARRQEFLCSRRRRLEDMWALRPDDSVGETWPHVGFELFYRMWKNKLFEHYCGEDVDGYHTYLRRAERRSLGLPA